MDASFVFYPWKKDKEACCFMGHGGLIRIPTGLEQWQAVGPGTHVRVAFDDGINYLGVIAYETASKDWHLFFEDDEEIDIKVFLTFCLVSSELCAARVLCTCVCVCV